MDVIAGGERVLLLLVDYWSVDWVWVSTVQLL